MRPSAHPAAGQASVFTTATSVTMPPAASRSPPPCMRHHHAPPRRWGYHGERNRGNAVVLLQNGTFPTRDELLPPPAAAANAAANASAAPPVTSAAGPPPAANSYGPRRAGPLLPPDAAAGAAAADPAAAADDDGAASAAAPAPANGYSASGPKVQPASGSVLLDQGRELYGYDVVMPGAEVPTNTTNYLCVKASRRPSARQAAPAPGPCRLARLPPACLPFNEPRASPVTLRAPAYACHARATQTKVPDGRRYHIVATQALIDSPMVHHLLLFACRGAAAPQVSARLRQYSSSRANQGNVLVAATQQPARCYAAVRCGWRAWLAWRSGTWWAGGGQGHIHHIH
jgi:hypothetical protein